MSSAAHTMHATETILKHTAVGRNVTGYAVTGTVSAANLIGGAAFAGMVAAAAPVAVPLAIAGGVAYLVSKLSGRH